MGKSNTLDLKKRICPQCKNIEVTTEVDYDSDGRIEEIRVWSEEFQAFLPVSLDWLENNFPGRLAVIQQRVDRNLDDVGVREYEPEEEIYA